MNTFVRGRNRCVYGGQHTTIVDGRLVDVDDTVTHWAVRDDSNLTNGVCGWHAAWLLGRGGWTVTPIGGAL